MSLTARILLLVLLALVPALAIQGYNEIALRASRDAAVRTDALATARAVADDLAQVADGVNQALDLVAQDPSVRSRDPAECSNYLRRAHAVMPHIALLALTQPDGTVICNSLGSAPGAYSNASRAYHRRALAEGGFVMGGYAHGVATGKDSIHFAQPLRNDDGETVGVLVAAIDLGWLAQHLKQTLRMPSTSLTVADETNTIIIRHPDGAGWIGKPIPPERQSLLATRGEGVRVDLGIDGRERILANARPRNPAVQTWITVGRDRDLAFADVDMATQRGLILIALGAVLAVAAALIAGRMFIRRPFSRLLHVASAWQRGDLTARTGLDGGSEFGQLGSKLDRMAAALERNEGELRAEIGRSRAMQEQQTTMLHELNHRVKNTLATVQSLVRQSKKGGEEKDVQLEARILSLSKTHDLLTRDDWAGASLYEVLDNELSPYRTGPDHIVLQGTDVALPPRHVLALGMTFHELTTNAAKYGALSVPGGRIEVSWYAGRDEDGQSQLHLTWQESRGPRVVPPTRQGFGTRLIAGGVRRELAGEVDLAFDEAGLCCKINLSLAAIDASMLIPTQ